MLCAAIDKAKMPIFQEDCGGTPGRIRGFTCSEFNALVEQCRTARGDALTKTTTGMKKKKERRVYLPRVLGKGQVMMRADLKRLHKYMLEIEHISVISDEVRTVVEEEWPELADKLPPKAQH